jgi:hypothetical protein
LENDFQVDVEGISDEQILHSAVGMLLVHADGRSLRMVVT